MGRRKIEVDPKRVRDYYTKRELSTVESAWLLGISSFAFRYKAMEIGLEMRTRGEARRIYGKRVREGIVFLYKERGLGVEQIADKMRFEDDYVRDVLLQEGQKVEAKRNGREPKLPPIDELDKIKKANCLTDGQLAETYGVKAQSIAAARLRNRRRKG